MEFVNLLLHNEQMQRSVDNISVTLNPGPNPVPSKPVHSVLVSSIPAVEISSARKSALEDPKVLRTLIMNLKNHYNRRIQVIIPLVLINNKTDS